MTIENQVRMSAGTFILASLLLEYFVSPYWLGLTAFVGATLLQSSFTQFCPLELLLQKLRRRRIANP